MENIDSSSISSGEPGMKPTHTSLPESYADSELAPYPAPATVAPYKGATFIIRDPQKRSLYHTQGRQVRLSPRG